MRSRLIPSARIPPKLTERLDYWAKQAPEPDLPGARGPDGNWRRLVTRMPRARPRRIGQALVNRGLSPERPIAVLSANGPGARSDGFGALYAGIPYAPISPAYSLVSSGLAKLRHIFQLLTPGMVFAANGAKYRRAIQAVLPADAELGSDERSSPRGHAVFRSRNTTEGPSLETAHAMLLATPSAKILFTSGIQRACRKASSTRIACGPATRRWRWLTSRFMADEPPVILDWAAVEPHLWR